MSPDRSRSRQGSGRRRVLMLASVASMIDQFNMPNIKLLQEMGCEVHVACNFRKGNTCDAAQLRKLVRRLDGMGVRCFQWDCPRNVYAAGRCMKAFRQLWRLTGEYRYDMIHCHSPAGGALARVAAHYRDIPVIYTAHGFHFYKGAPLHNWLLYYPAEWLLSWWTDVLVTINREDYMRAKRQFHAGKTVYVPGTGVDVEKFSGVPGNMECPKPEGEGMDGAVPDTGNEGRKSRFRRPGGDSFLVLHVAELTKNKNQISMIRAVELAGDDGIRYLVCGIGREEQELRRYVRCHGLEDRVRFLGYRTDIPGLLRASDCFVLPSYREGLPVALMEAMCAGLPLVVSGIRGNVDLADAGGCLFVRPWDIRGMADALLKLRAMKRDEPEAFYGMGRRNQKKIRRFDKKYVQKSMAFLYREILEQKGREWKNAPNG